MAKEEAREDTLLEAKDLRKWFEVKRFLRPPLRVRAVDGVTFALRRGEAIAIVGESGSGKTTLGKTALRIYEPTGGDIIFDGRDIAHLEEDELKSYRREAQYVPQDPYSALNPFFTIYKSLEEPLIVNKIGGDSGERRKIVADALEEVKLTPVAEFAGKYPHMLSGGQRQRAVIARAISMRPKLIVADEPVSMLDASVRVEILYLLKELQEKHRMSFIYITHDLSTVRYFSERLAIMYAGKIVEMGGVREVIQKPSHPYTQALLEAIPDPDPSNRFAMRRVPAGEPPNLINPPPGCRFHPRCPYAMDICGKVEPPYFKVGPGRSAACWLLEGKVEDRAAPEPAS